MHTYTHTYTHTHTHTHIHTHTHTYTHTHTHTHTHTFTQTHIHTQPQYVFIHDALLEAIECGITEVAARDLRDQYKKLGVVDIDVGKNGLEIEFDKLSSTVHSQPANKYSMMPFNKVKNRYTDTGMLPCENYIVLLLHTLCLYNNL